MEITSTSAVMLCLPQRSSISTWVSAMLPMIEPESAVLLPTINKSERCDCQWLFRRADESNFSLGRGEQLEIRIDVVIGGDAVEDELEGPGALFHLFLVSGKNYLVSPQSQRVLTLVLGRGENHDMCAHRLCEFHAHVTESAQADDAHFFARPDLRTP